MSTILARSKQIEVVKAVVLTICLSIMVVMFIMYGIPSAHAQTEVAAQFQDPDKPTVQYVLNKLDRHLIQNAINMSEISDLRNAVAKQQAVIDTVATIKATQDVNSKMLTSLLVGVFGIILKEVLAFFKRST